MRNKQTGQIGFSNNVVETYMKKNRLSPAYLILNQSWITLIGRQMLFTEKAQHYRKYISDFNFAKTNISYDIVVMQLMLLDLLSNVFMSLEDYLGHSHHLRSSIKNFPKQIASNNWKVASNEIDYLKSLRKNEIPKYLLFSDISKLTTNNVDFRIVKKIYRKITQIIYSKIKRLLKFYKRYYRVYTKYKHILPAVLGLYGRSYDINKKPIVTSNIYIRDKVFIGDKNKSKYKYNTHIILSSGLKSLSYYEEIMEDVKQIFGLVILSYVNSMVNLGRPFLIPVNDCINEEYRSQWEKITRTANITSVISPNLEIKFSFVEPLKGKLEKYLPKDTVYKLNRDLLSGNK